VLTTVVVPAAGHEELPNSVVVAKTVVGLPTAVVTIVTVDGGASGPPGVALHVKIVETPPETVMVVGGLLGLAGVPLQSETVEMLV